MSEKRFLLLVTAVVVVMAGLPYLAGIQNSGQDHIFGGFLLNPVDGQSYLAKMRQGYQGDWRFKLPYTENPGSGAYLFLFYILLGHLARLLNLPLLAVFHTSRISGGLFLLYSIYRLTEGLFFEARDRRLFLLLAAMGSGMGWLAVSWGAFTSDFWVAEAYPFLSIYANPHFPVGLALMVTALDPNRKRTPLTNIVIGGLLAIIQPFGVIIVGLVKITVVVHESIPKRLSVKELLSDSQISDLLGFGLFAAPVLLYQYWAILNDPVLSAWNAQNVTSTPSPGDLLIALSPCLPLAVMGAVNGWKNGTGKYLAIWGGISLVLILVPWNLQRRFLTGIYLPLAGLAVWGMNWLQERLSVRRILLIVIVLILALPTNLIVVVSGIQAVRNRNSQIFIDGCTMRALEWLKSRGSGDELVLANPETGLLIPPVTGQRVVYGHPFETVDADKKLVELDKFYSQQPGSQFYQEYVSERQIDYVLLTETPNSELGLWLSDNWKLGFSSAHCTVYYGSGND